AAQAIEAGLSGNELLLELGAPGRMGEVAGGDHADALAARPGGEMLEIEIPARRPRVFRLVVQVRVEAHLVSRFRSSQPYPPPSHPTFPTKQPPPNLHFS